MCTPTVFQSQIIFTAQVRSVCAARICLCNQKTASQAFLRKIHEHIFLKRRKNKMRGAQIVKETRTWKQHSVVGGRTVSSFTTIFVRIDISVHRFTLIKLLEHVYTRHDQIILFISSVTVSSGFGISYQRSWRSDWRFFALVNIVGNKIRCDWRYVLPGVNKYLWKCIFEWRHCIATALCI